MTGKYHKRHNIPFGILVVLTGIVIFGFNPYYILSVPIIWFTATLPDIDQANTAPKEWKLIKNIWIAILVLLPIASIGGLGYGIYIKNARLTTIGVVMLLSMLALNSYKNSKNGKFLWAHRGFTHTLIMPIILSIVFWQLNKIDDFKVQILNIFVLGIDLGIIGHIWLDLMCKAGCPILYPITNTKIHLWNAITSDKNAKDGTHISSKITTNTLCVIYVILIIFLMYQNKESVINLVAQR